LKSLKERDLLDDLGIDGKILKWIIKKSGGRVWTGYIWVRIGAGGGLL
jgi:hypothetical protein